MSVIVAVDAAETHPSLSLLPPPSSRMLLLLLGIIFLHVAALVLLFVSTIVSVSKRHNDDDNNCDMTTSDHKYFPRFGRPMTAAAQTCGSTAPPLADTHAA